LVEQWPFKPTVAGSIPAVPTMKIIVQNLAVEYQDEGAGKVILLLHGWQDNLRTFDALVPLLSVTNRVIRLDCPGFGQSETPKETWDLDNYVKFVENFIQKLHLQVDVLIGHSFGGRIAIKGAADKNLQPNKIVLVNSAGIAKNKTLRNSVLKTGAKIAGAIIRIPPLSFWREKLRKKIYESIGSDYLNAGAMKETFLKIIAEDLTESAKKINIPTLLIWGANDAETPLSDGQRLAKLIPDSKLEIINGAGHFIHQEKPEEVANIIQNWTSKV
jgi:pimeloyl-ACP methyl ester carboxylesterase